MRSTLVAMESGEQCRTTRSEPAARPSPRVHYHPRPNASLARRPARDLEARGPRTHGAAGHGGRSIMRWRGGPDVFERNRTNRGCRCHARRFLDQRSTVPPLGLPRQDHHRRPGKRSGFPGCPFRIAIVFREEAPPKIPSLPLVTHDAAMSSARDFGGRRQECARRCRECENRQNRGTGAAARGGHRAR